MKTSLWTSIIISILLSQLIKSEGNYQYNSLYDFNVVTVNIQLYLYYIFFIHEIFIAVLQYLSIYVAQCTDGTLDIINQVNDDVKDNGQLFICSNDTWFPLCFTNFDSDEAQAACRQLGFVDGSKL